MICHNALSCTDFSLTFRLFQWSFTLCDVYHMMTSWLSRKCVITKYIYLFIVIDKSQVNSMIICMIFCLIISFALIWCMWITHFSLKFNWTFKTLISDFELIWCFINFTSTFVLNHSKIFIKWINSCFVIKNFNVMRFWSLFASIINLIKNFAIAFYKLFICQDIDVIHEVCKADSQLDVITCF